MYVYPIYLKEYVKYCEWFIYRILFFIESLSELVQCFY